MQAVIRCAEKVDFNRIVDFLETAGLGTEGISTEKLPYFLLMENSMGEIKGMMGLESFGESGLLRSLVITPDMGEKDLIFLFKEMMLLAKKRRVFNLFLATNKKGALDFFHVLGFRETERENLPEELVHSPHIKHILNVDNSIFLKFSF
ncbi:GNAT family N-acetyltransferase [Neobacillus terrae]|uniref:GNAT family N-acetyltransferase n=1 Tax=Neobacillus terrae TaxID=3034837 RepID=UPI00140CE553|nr:hypothetical protein [Neobacillus terrae]NHM30103.1 hypothetical protein [Neobacillus terrae]